LRYIRRLLAGSVRRSKASTLDTSRSWFWMRKRLLFATLVIWLVVAFRHLYQQQNMRHGGIGEMPEPDHAS
jgi:hypothetical protein